MQEREAINEILVNINELPLDDTDVIEDINIAVVANTFLNVSRKEVLSYGWNFNSLTLNMYPNVSGYIIVPDSVLSIDPTADTSTIITRDYKLYDNSTQSFQFTDSVECQIVDDIAFDDIPFVVANYIVKLAVLNTYSNQIGDAKGIDIRANLLKLAKIEAYRDDANKHDGNILTSTFATTALDRTSL